MHFNIQVISTFDLHFYLISCTLIFAILFDALRKIQIAVETFVYLCNLLHSINFFVNIRVDFY